MPATPEPDIWETVDRRASSASSVRTDRHDASMDPSTARTDDAQPAERVGGSIGMAHGVSFGAAHATSFGTAHGFGLGAAPAEEIAVAASTPPAITAAASALTPAMHPLHAPPPDACAACRLRCSSASPTVVRGGSAAPLSAADSMGAAPGSSDGAAARAVVGGVDYAVGGWGAYEISRRRERWRAAAGALSAATTGGAAAIAESERPGHYYPGRRHIDGGDAAESVLAARGGAHAKRKAIGEHAAAGRGESALQRAARAFGDALGALEARLCELDEAGDWQCLPATALNPAAASAPEPAPLGAPLAPERAMVVPPLTSLDLRDFADDPAQERDPEALRALSEGVLATAAAVGADVTALPELPALPALPHRTVAVGEDEAVLRLERDVRPYVAGVEQMQAALAAQLDAAARALRRPAVVQRADAIALGGASDDDHGDDGDCDRGVRSLRGGNAAPKSGSPLVSDTSPDATKGKATRNLTRGEMVDAAARAPPPEAAMRDGLPFSGQHRFSIGDDGKIVVATSGTDAAAVYRGISDGGAVRNRSRTTLLSPEVVDMVAVHTSGRGYAWYVFDGPEGRIAVRAAPRDGAILRVDVDALIDWIRARLEGDPPHKMPLATYLDHLRSLGLTVVLRAGGSGRREELVRFDYESSTPAAVRRAAVARLRALDVAELVGYDWSGFDRVVESSVGGKKFPASNTEIGGEVLVDIDRRVVTVAKFRPGTHYEAFVHQRAPVIFHTHPAARSRGRRAEPPSPADVRSTLILSAFKSLAWHFVAAPEGVYLLRPSAVLLAAYLRDPENIEESVMRTYESSLGWCSDATRLCARKGVRALLDAGFVAALREQPYLTLSADPDLEPVWNRLSPAETRAAFAEAAAVTGRELLTADWGAVLAFFPEHIGLDALSWLSASLSREPNRADPSTNARWRIVPNGEGHGLETLADPESSLGNFVPGPLFVIHVARLASFPLGVPAALIQAARARLTAWAWVAIVSDSRVLVFRIARDGGVESHGPAELVPSAAPVDGLPAAAETAAETVPAAAPLSAPAGGQT